MAKQYIHTIIELQCFIESPTEKSVKIKLPSNNDWTLNLESILKRIPKKFKFLQNINESHWSLFINNTMINKQDPVQFGKLLSSMAPTAIIQIVKTSNNRESNKEENRMKELNDLRINYKSSSIIWKPLKPYINTEEYWDNNYKDLINNIKTSNHLNIKANKFKLQDMDQCEIIDGYDLNAIYKSIAMDNNEQHMIDIDLVLITSNDDEKGIESVDDINEEANKIIDDMELDEIHKLQNAINNDENDDNKDDAKSNNKYYAYDFDTNGIIYWLGTNRGTSPWINPAIRGNVKVFQSSLEKDSVAGYAFIGRDTVRCVTESKKLSWFMVDLLSIKVKPRHYTLRHYLSSDTECIRNWRLEACNNSKNGHDGNWICLVEHDNDTSLNEKGATHSWSIPTTNNKSYSQFRIFQFGLNSNGRHVLAISGFEIYGAIEENAEIDDNKDDAKSNKDNQLNADKNKVNNEEGAIGDGMSWMHAINGIGHELWPKLASAVRSISICCQP